MRFSSVAYPLMVLAGAGAALPSAFAEDDATPDAAVFGPVTCEGRYPAHLQGVCTNERDALYWSFTTTLLKTDVDGKVQRKVSVANHHGDLCHDAGRIYVAVNLGKFNQVAGQADSWVFVYDAGDLRELARHKVPEVVHGAGGIASQDGRFIVVGGLPDNVPENYLYEYDAEFTFRQRHVLASGYTRLGIQTAAHAGGSWWFGCYGKPTALLRTDGALSFQSRYEFDCSLGIVGLADGRFLVARGDRDEAKTFGARLVVAVPDAKTGLVLRP